MPLNKVFCRRVLNQQLIILVVPSIYCCPALPVAKIFQKALLNFYRPKECSVFNIFDPVGLKLLTRLRVNLSHLREHKFRHNFLDTLIHFVVVIWRFTTIRKTLLDNIVDLIGTISNLSDDKLVNLLLYGPLLFNIYINDLLLYMLQNTETCNYADDTAIHASSDNLLDLMKRLEHDSLLAITWFENN